VTLTYDYNQLDDVTRITYPDGTYETRIYSGSIPHLVSAITDRAAKTTTYDYDRLNRIIGITRPDGSTIAYERDANGNVTAITDPNGNTTHIVYNLDNQPVQEIYPDGTTLSRSFQYAGIVEALTQPNGTYVTFSYDPAFNLTSVSSGSFWDDVTYAYDEYNRRVSVTDSRGETTYTYDAASRLTSITGPAGSGMITLSYDNAGRLTGLAIGDRSLTYTYDPLGRVTRITEGGKSHTLGYTAANPLPITLTRPSGSSTTIQRDELNRPQQVDNKKSTSSFINRFTYTYPTGRDLPASETVTGGAPPPAVPSALQVYEYDTMDRPVSGTDPARSYAWDQNGNLTAGYAADGSPFTATYDNYNRLTALDFTDAGGVARHAEYRYDGDGWLVGTKETADGATVRDATFVRLGRLLLQERDGSGTVVRDYTWSDIGRGAKNLLSLRQVGVDYDYLFDGRGRVAALIDSSQTAVAGYGYDSFGTPATTGSVNQPFRSSFAQFDDLTGLYQYSSRYFLPNPGIEISRQLAAQPGNRSYGQYFRPFRDVEMRPTAAVPLH
jgi:YD repeat-containing protein